MRTLIVGAAGFVGKHLIEYLVNKADSDVYVTKLKNEKINASLTDKNIIDLDITNKAETYEIIDKIKPEVIINLAAQSSVSLSWKEPALTYSVNVIGTVNLIEAVKSLKLNSRILLIGSAEEYGAIKQDDLPIKEELKVKPSNPYAISKASQEMIADLYVKTYGMDIIMVRAFNHIGPGQSPIFVISDFAKQIAEIEKGIKDAVIKVGDLNVKRDFTDVRDIVRGYYMLVQEGKKGEVYNIGSGNSVYVKEMLERLIKLSSQDIKVIVDPEKIRPVDIPELRADIRKISIEIGWKPEISIDDSLRDIIEYWRCHV